MTATLFLFDACGGGSSSYAVKNQGPESLASVPATAAETGPASKLVRVPGSSVAMVALFPDGQVFYSPDGYNLGGGGSTVMAYAGPLIIQDIVATNTGIVALMSDGTAYLSPDGKQLGGGGATTPATSHGAIISGIVAVNSGVDSILANGGGYFSPDGLNLDGGGSSVSIIRVGAGVAQIVPIGPGDAVVVRTAAGSAYYSPDNRNLTGGGRTVLVGGTARMGPITNIVKVGGGILAALNNGSVYLSPDGRNLSGGGVSIAVATWDNSVPDGPFGPRDDAHGTEFLGRLWLSGGYALPTNTDSCFITCSYYDLWSSTDSSGTSWGSAPDFAVAIKPNPRDATPIVNNGVQDAALPHDFYDSYAALTVWDNQLTALGATVWRSADGRNWQRVNQADGVTAAVGPAGASHATENSRALQLNGSLYFLQMDTGDVQVSIDASAATWTDLGAIAGFSPRCGAMAFVAGGRMWIEGGGACDYSAVYNDMWSSEDGITWSQESGRAAWSERMWPCVASTVDGVAWMVGGYAPTDWNNTFGITRRYGANHGDVWYSKDGTDWKQYKADYGAGMPDDGKFEPRHAPTCYVSANGGRNTLVVVAGTGFLRPDDSDAHTLNSIRTLALPATGSLP